MVSMIFLFSKLTLQLFGSELLVVHSMELFNDQWHLPTQLGNTGEMICMYRVGKYFMSTYN